jgi:uncharacterized membrane protein HdeD (DUF308 family)
MSAAFPYFLSPGADRELRPLRRNWGWFLALGVLLVLLGTAAIGYPIVATLATVELFGVFLLVAAGVEFVSGVWAIGWGGFFPHLLCGLLSLFLGVLLVDRPGLGAAGYTLVLAVFFVASGVLRIGHALSRRFSGRGLTLLSGAITLLLGVLIWRDFPESALWVIGTFVGIDLVFNGLSWVMLGLAARALPSGPVPADTVPDRLVRA